MNGTADAGLLNINGQVGLLGDLIWIINAGEALDLSVPSLGVNTSLVGALSVLEGSSDMDEIEVTILLNDLTSMLSSILVRSNWSGDDSCASASEFGGNESNTANVAGAITATEAELRRQFRTNGLAKKERDGTAALLVQSDVEGTSNSILSAVLVAGEEDSETLSRTWRVRFSQNANNFGIGEPFRDFATVSETATELSARDVKSANASWDLILRTVLVTVWQVGHHLERYDLNTKLGLVLLDCVLCIIRTVEFLSLAVLPGSCMITANDEVRCTKVLADDGVPDSFARASHTHSQRQKAENSHAIGVSREKCLVDTNSGEMIDISRLRKADNRMDEDIGLAGTSSTNSQFSVGSVHRVSGLEGNNFRPAKLVKVKSQLSRSIWR